MTSRAVEHRIMANQVTAGPDRGYSWVICFAACCSSLILAGIFRTSGVLFVALMKEFGVTREEASWPAVICVSFLNLTGIITGPLALRYGIRPVVLLGSLVATFGISSCYLTTSLDAIIVLFGVVFGIGYGLVSTLMPVIVNEYFVRHKATASGIANAGSCVGGIILPPLFEYLIDTYELSGCFLLTGSVVLHVAISGALLRPPPWYQKSKSDETRKGSNAGSISSNLTNSSNIPSGYDAVIKTVEHSNSTEQTYSEVNELIDGPSTSMGIRKNEHVNAYSVSCKVHPNSEHVNKIRHRTASEQHSMQDIKVTIRNSLMDENNDNIDDEADINAAECYRTINDLDNSLRDFKNFSMQRSTEPKFFDSSNGSDRDNLELKYENRNYFNPNSAHIKIYSTIENSEKLKTESNFEAEEKLQYSKGNLRFQNTNANKPPSFHEAHENGKCILHTVFTDKVDERTNELGQNICTSRTNQMNSSHMPLDIMTAFKCVLSSPMFYVTAATNVSFYFLYHMYVIIIVDFSTDRGVTETQTNYVLYAFAISDFFGRLCFGWITDRNIIPRHYYVMICMFLIGLTFIGFPLAYGCVWLMVVSCLYGLLLGCTMIVFPIILADFLGMEMHGVAMGCMCFLNGLATLSRPFLIGYFRDYKGSYSYIFLGLGVISLASSLLWLLKNYFVKTGGTTQETKKQVTHRS